MEKEQITTNSGVMQEAICKCLYDKVLQINSFYTYICNVCLNIF